MSASSKKKLRKEQKAAELTKKQQQQRAESKKLKSYSITFIAIIAVVLVAAIAIFGITAAKRSGFAEKNTIAAVVDGEELNSVEMNYYYVDSVNSTYNQWASSYGDAVASYAAIMGLDVTQPLDEQVYDEETGATWADYFYDIALEQAKSDFVLVKKAAEDGFTLSEEEITALESSVDQMHSYVLENGYTNVNEFYRASYGNGASEDSYRAYAMRTALASAYYNDYVSKLDYDDADYRAHEADQYDHYNSYNFASYYVSYSSYLGEGTKNEDGTTTYTDEQRQAARDKAKVVAQQLGATGSVEELDAAILALPENADAEEGSVEVSGKNKNVLYSDINSIMLDWITDASRKEGDMTVLENESTSTDADGNKTPVVNGYYIVVFQSKTENLRPLANVRHLLVAYESEDSSAEPTEEEKAAVRAKAEELLAQWEAGEATEESFIALVKENTDDTGSAETGGLYENITPEQGVYVEEFTDWAVDENRFAGETGIIETQFGCHIMYYVGDSDITYRDSLIRSVLMQEDIMAWYDETVTAASAEKGDTSKLATGMVLSSYGA